MVVWWFLASPEGSRGPEETEGCPRSVPASNPEGWPFCKRGSMLKAGRLTAPLTDVPLQAANGRQDWSVILCPGAPWPPVPSCRRAQPRPLRTNAEVPSVWRGCFGGLRRHLRAASPGLDGHGRQGGILRGRGLGWHSAAISDLKRGETNCLGRRPPRRPAVAVLWFARGPAFDHPPSVPEGRLSWAAGGGIFFCFLHDLQSMPRRRCPKSIWIKVRPLSPAGGLEKRGRDEPGPRRHIKDVETKKISESIHLHAVSLHSGHKLCKSR